jgi:hypothetical protein
MLSSCPQTISAGSYLAGALAPLDHARFGQHAEACAHCKREITELLPIVRQLQRAKEAGVDLSATVPEQASPHH